MNTTKYLLWPIHLKWLWKPLIGGWSFGPGARYEAGWIGRQDQPGSYKLMGWTFFIGPLLIKLGKSHFKPI